MGSQVAADRIRSYFLWNLPVLAAQKDYILIFYVLDYDVYATIALDAIAGADLPVISL